MLNYPPPTFSPDTGLFYINENNGAVGQLPDGAGSARVDGARRHRAAAAASRSGTNIVAIDYKTGKIAWRKKINGGSPGLLSTAGGVLFVSNGQNVEAWDAATGKGLWYSQIGGLQSPPETFMLDGKQHMLFTRRRVALYVRAELIRPAAACQEHLQEGQEGRRKSFSDLRVAAQWLSMILKKISPDLLSLL